MKILLTGKGGQLGFELRRSLAVLGAVHAVGSMDCDLCDEQAIRQLVERVKPDVIVNPAAYTAVDRAEHDPSTAQAVNAGAPRVLAQEAKRLGALLVHFSTDYVFDGSKAGWYTETDAPCPQNVYGASKLAGERAIAEACEQHLILRTSWLVGAHGRNFAKTMLELAAERDALNVVADQWGAPTSASLLADLTAHLVRQATQASPESFPYGLYHAAASGETSWHGYAMHVIERARSAGKPIRLQPQAICPISSALYPTQAKRPANSRLDTTKLRRTFGLNLPPWQEGLDHILDQIFS